MIWFLIGLGIPVLLLFGFAGLIQLLNKKADESNSESNSSSGIAYMSPEEMLSHARDIAEAPLPSQTTKPASVTGRAIVGGILGGAPGAIIGAASAIDKNNRSK